ncbi:hypothetical protein HMPREF1986_01643 [Oribacterium sp. oral taxon 078 str. F0263]|nr:hypothetical protein HMPREF1986_01643 [Oribacterium sp. oral taxon 078 str. F0263]
MLKIRTAAGGPGAVLFRGNSPFQADPCEKDHPQGRIIGWEKEKSRGDHDL